MPVKIAVLVSGGGTNLQALIDACDRGQIDGQVALVVGSRKGIYALERARNHHIDAVVVSSKQHPDLVERGERLLALFAQYQIDLIVLGGYLSMISPAVVRAYENRIVNTHPALIPAFCGKGFYGERVHQAVLDYGAKVSGVTIHLVNEQYDAGPIVLQGTVPVKEGDTAQTLAARVLEVEHRLLPEAVALLAEGRIRVDGRIVHILEKA